MKYPPSKLLENFYPQLVHHNKLLKGLLPLKKKRAAISDPTIGMGIPINIPARLPTTEPIIENHMPRLVPPAFFVLMAPVKNSRTSPRRAKKIIKIIVITPISYGDSDGINQAYVPATMAMHQLPGPPEALRNKEIIRSNKQIDAQIRLIFK